MTQDPTESRPIPSEKRVFADRREAGRVLATHLLHHLGHPDVVVLGLPRGGVPVAYEVATALGAPLDVFVVRKLGVPGHEELAMGAIATGGVLVLNDDVVRARCGSPMARSGRSRNGKAASSSDGSGATAAAGPRSICAARP